jgi:predicted Rossmann fold flavoprotein
VFGCQSLVVATGGKSWVSLGASSLGYQIARQFGHEVTELRPGLVPLVLKGRTPFSGLNGISFRATVTAASRSFTDDVLVTHRGLSGPAVLQASSFWREGEPVTLDLLPGEYAHEWLMAHKGERRELRNLIATRLPRRLGHRMAEHCGGSAPMNSLSERQIKRIAQTLSSLELRPSGTEGFAHAEVTVGGISTQRISSKSMESLITPGLFFIGEVIDVTGELGGFNLHWAWVSAMAAGEHL